MLHPHQKEGYSNSMANYVGKKINKYSTRWKKKKSTNKILHNNQYQFRREMGTQNQVERAPGKPMAKQLKQATDNFYAYVIWIFKPHSNYLIFLSFIASFGLKH